MTKEMRDPEMIVLKLDIPKENWVFEGVRIARSAIQYDNRPIAGESFDEMAFNGSFWRTFELYRDPQPPRCFFLVEETVLLNPQGQDRKFTAGIETYGDVFLEAGPLLTYLADRAKAGEGYGPLVASLIEQAKGIDPDIRLEAVCRDPKAFEDWMQAEGRF